MTLGAGIACVAGTAAVVVATGGAAAPAVAGLAATAAGSSIGSAAALATGAGAAGVASAAATGAAVGSVAAAAATGGAASAAVAAGTAATVGAGTISSTMFSGWAVGASFGPVGMFFFCFEKNTTVQKTSGETLKITEIEEGDEIYSFDALKKVKQSTRVTNLKTLYGEFSAHKFTLSYGFQLCVTSPHIMCCFSEDGVQSFIAARSVKVGHQMMNDKGQLLKIVDIEDCIIDTKVNVETDKGTMVAGNILTTGFCENLPDQLSLHEKIVDVYVNTHKPIFAR